MPIRALFVVLVLATLPACAQAQGARLDLPNLDHLRSKASQTVNVDVGGLVLHIAARFLDTSDPDQAQAREILNQLDSVQVRSFEFDSDDAYSQSDVQAVRNQLKSPKWTPIVQVRDREQDGDVDVYLCIENETPVGFAVIASERRTLTIVNVSGPIDLERLRKISGRFGIPDTGV